MGRPPSGGGPAFRFTQAEVTEMENILQEHNNAVPPREVLVALAEKFSESEDRKGKISVQMKQVWNWFQNKRYAIRAKYGRSPMTGEESSPGGNAPQSIASPVPASMSVPMPAPPSAPVHLSAPPSAPAHVPAPVLTSVPAPASTPPPSVATTGRDGLDNYSMEFEAKSARDGAWYDVGSFLSHRHLETSDPEVFVRFSGFGEEEDEWINIRKHIRLRSLPCESSECCAVLPGDLILCFQEVKEQALYFDAHVLDAQRRRHDARGCRCRFLVRYDHDQTEEIVPLRKICRRPETDYRLQKPEVTDQQKSNMDPSLGSASKVLSNSTTNVQNQ